MPSRYQKAETMRENTPIFAKRLNHLVAKSHYVNFKAQGSKAGEAKRRHEWHCPCRGT
jgi:hypothetical protein